MAIPAKKATLTTLLQTFRTKLLALFNVTVQQVNTADNALKLGGLTTTQIVGSTQDLLDEHLGEPNPHNLSPEDIGSMGTNATLALFGAKVLQSALPVSGITVNGQLTVNSGKLVLPAGSTVFVSGIGKTTDVAINYTIPAIELGVLQYVYLELFESDCRLILTTERIPESQNIMFITSYFTITNVSNHTIPNTMNLSLRRIDSYRLSTTQVGSSFIATKSNPTQPVSNLWS